MSTKRTAAFFEVGDLILYGKYKNKKGRIVGFGDDGKGNPTVEIEPIPKGRKQNKTLGLFKVWKQKDVNKTAQRVTQRYLEASIASRVAARSKEAISYDDAKVKEFLLAARKKSLGKIDTLPKIQAMLDYLGGWRIEPFVGLVDMGDKMATEHSGDLDEIEAKLKKLEVSSVPSNPKVDNAYVQGVQRKQGRGEYIEYKLWIGAAGVKCTSPEGRVYELLPDNYDLDGGRPAALPWEMKRLGKRNSKALKSNMYNLFKWLYKDTKFMDQVLQALEMPSLDKEREQKVRTRDNTGTCSVCARNVKLKKSGDKYRMADHGYERPGHGFNEGNCPGVPFPPYEISPEGTKFYHDHLKERLDDVESEIRDLESGKKDTLSVQWGGPASQVQVVKKGDEMWDRAVRRTLSSLNSQASYFKDKIPQYKKAITSWKSNPLPKEGEPFKQLFVIR